MRTVIVGDVHGCLDELLAIVERCGAPGDTHYVMVGDLVAKGPDSQGVVQWARESGADAVLGNHDAHLLGTRDDEIAKRRPHHAAVAETLRPADWTWLEARPLWLPVGASHLVVHGGLVPGVPLEKQERKFLLNLRSITDDGEPSKAIEGRPWGSVWNGPPHVVYGHDAVRGLQQYTWATGLDTGCVYGRALSALVLPAGDIVSMPARRAYAAIKG
jgi:hypothetical protein